MVEHDIELNAKLNLDVEVNGPDDPTDEFVRGFRAAYNLYADGGG